jgi:hypothetical protein
MKLHYFEIVSTDVDAVRTLYERVLGRAFGPPDPDLGGANVATGPDAPWSGSDLRSRRTRTRV